MNITHVTRNKTSKYSIISWYVCGVMEYKKDYFHKPFWYLFDARISKIELHNGSLRADQKKMLPDGLSNLASSSEKYCEILILWQTKPTVISLPLIYCSVIISCTIVIFDKRASKIRSVLHIFDWLIFHYFLQLIFRLTTLTSAAKSNKKSVNQKSCHTVLILDTL